MSDFAYPLHEECGVFGIYDRAGTEDVAAAAYSALYALQHRGQESCGIAVNDDGVITGHRDLGLVNEVFTPEVLASLSTTTAHMATGHVRYATAGTRVRANAQPMIVRHGRGTMALCHNGNLTDKQKRLRYTRTTAFNSAYALPTLCTKLHDAPDMPNVVSTHETRQHLHH